MIPVVQVQAKFEIGERLKGISSQIGLDGLNVRLICFRILLQGYDIVVMEPIGASKVEAVGVF